MKYLIRIEQRKPSGDIFATYSKTVEGEPVVIPGFEQIKLFTFNDRDDDTGDAWNVSEEITGYAIVDACDCMSTKESAIELSSKKLNKKGLQWILDNIKKYKPVAKYPEWKEAK